MQLKDECTVHKSEQKPYSLFQPEQHSSDVTVVSLVYLNGQMKLRLGDVTFAEY